MKETARDYRFDTLKGGLIFLVVLGHVIIKGTAIQGREGMLSRIIVALIYAFHMPSFIFISGYFTKAAPNSPESGRKLLSSVLIPFIVFQLIAWLKFTRSMYKLFTPEWTLWYLLSLFFWRTFARSFSQVRGALPISIALSLCIGFTRANHFLSISRTVAFFPYFLAGYLAGEGTIGKLCKSNRALPILTLSTAFAAVLFMTTRRIPMRGIFEMARPYKELGLSPAAGAATRALSLLIGFAVLFSLIALTPDRPNRVARLGRNSVTVYLLHSFLLRLCEEAFSNHTFREESFQTPVCLASAVMITALICLTVGSDAVAGLYSRAMRRISGRILKPDFRAECE